MSVFKEEFIGFTYNGVHSSELGILRVSDGSRLNEGLLPTMQDKTVQIPGGDGTYYFGSYYTQRQFDISFAFDNVTEEQLNFMKELFGDKKIHTLVFDEAPYKQYMAKVTGTNNIKYIPFSQGATNRVYKGEGDIQFTCYSPFAVCTKKDIKMYSEEEDRIIEWNSAAHLIDLKNYDKPENSEGQIYISLYNPGVKESEWEMIVAFNEDGTIPSFELAIENNQLNLNNIKAKKNNFSFNDTFLCLNSKTNLIEGMINTGTSEEPVFQKTGNIYNEFITNGFFFKIPVTIKRKIGANPLTNEVKMIINSQEELKLDNIYSFNYNYYYF